MEAVGYGEVGGLPVHTFTEDGERKAKPCAEGWLTDRASQAILRQGLIPIQSVKGRDAVRVGALQSVSGAALKL